MLKGAAGGIGGGREMRYDRIPASFIREIATVVELEWYNIHNDGVTIAAQTVFFRW